MDKITSLLRRVIIIIIIIIGGGVIIIIIGWRWPIPPIPDPEPWLNVRTGLMALGGIITALGGVALNGLNKIKDGLKR